MFRFLSFYFFTFLLITGIVLAKDVKKQKIPDNYQLLDRIIAVVNGRPVLESELILYQKFYRISDRKKALEGLIDQILISQIAKRRGLKVSPDEVKKALEKLAERNGITVEELKKLFAKEGIAVVEVKDLIRRQILVSRFIQLYIRDKLLEGMSEGKVMQFADIRILFLDKNSENFKEKYEKVKQALKNKDEKFSSIVKLYSDDILTKEDGGLLKNVKKGMLRAEVENKLWGRKRGDIFEVDTKEGVYIIKVEDIRKKLVEKGKDAEELNKKVKKEIDFLLKKLRENSIIEYMDYGDL